VLTLVRTTGATTAVTVTTTRKAMSIVVSFIFFAKPFTIQYVWSGLIIVLGIYLNVYSKRSKLSFTEMLQKLTRLLPSSSSEKTSRQRLLDV
jgi:adenosine 3'-phospho 5'-phosphosulfate transporter B3